MSHRPLRRTRQDPQALRFVRTVYGATAIDVARRAGISRPLLSELEAGTRNASAEVLRSLAAVYDCPISVLLRCDPKVLAEVDA